MRNRSLPRCPICATLRTLVPDCRGTGANPVLPSGHPATTSSGVSPGVKFTGVTRNGEDRDHQRVVHPSLHAVRRVQATRILHVCSMIGYPQSAHLLHAFRIPPRIATQRMRSCNLLARCRSKRYGERSYVHVYVRVPMLDE